MTITPEKLESKVVGSANTLLKERALNNDTFDWYNAVLNSGIQQNNYLSISGRSESGVGYNLGLGIQSETGNVENESLDKLKDINLLNDYGQEITAGVKLIEEGDGEGSETDSEPQGEDD